MRFSNKQIFNGDTKDLILEKANENFSQIVSFSSGPDGRPGAMGPTGYPGSAGPVGPSGATGTRASLWTVSATEPANPNAYDQWINQGSTGNGTIYQYDGSSWQNTGISTVESEFFQIKGEIPTFGAATDFSAIYLSGSDQENTYLAISDGDNSASTVNPNYSKLLVSTSDQTSNPVFSFRNSSSAQIVQPSFYWDQTGNSGKIRFSSDGGFVMYSNSSSITPQYSGSINASGRNFYFKSNQNISSQQMNLTSSGNLELNTQNYVLNSTQMTANTETYVYGAVNVEPAYSVASKADGVIITKGVTSSFPVVSFSTTQFQSETEDPSFNPFRQVFNINQSTAILDETDPITDVAYRDVRSRATFGATGDGYGIYDIWGSGIPTSPTGPFGYHVVDNTVLAPQVGSFYISKPQNSSNIRYFVDLSSVSNFYTDSITFSLPSTWAGGTAAYVKIPGYQSSPPSSSAYPLYGPDYVNEYKIFIDYGRFTTGTNQGIDKKIVGVVWDQLGNPPPGSSSPTIAQKFLTFTRPCYFFEIIYHFNNSNQVVAFIKTCNGQSTPIQITNYTSKPPAQFSLVPN